MTNLQKRLWISKIEVKQLGGNIFNIYQNYFPFDNLILRSVRSDYLPSRDNLICKILMKNKIIKNSTGYFS